MPSELEFTGERFVPGVALGEIVYEHVHRYAFACRFARGRRVLDAACGEGYGSALLAQAARNVVGVDIEAQAVAHAAQRYRDRASLRFAAGSVTELPLDDASVDLVVSFETVEHLAAGDQPRMLREFARVLAPGGLLLLSSPNRVEYSDARAYSNPFHLHELDRDELAVLLGEAFPARRWYRQRLWMGSTIWSEHPGNDCEAWTGDPQRIDAAIPPQAMYFLVLAAREADALPADVAVSLFTDVAESEIRRAQMHAAEAIRLDRLAGERLEVTDRQMHQLAQLQQIIADREHELQASRDALQAAHVETTSQIQALERALAAQERLILYRQSVRWWLKLPWVRARLLWHRLRGAA